MGDSDDIGVPSAVVAWLCRGAVTALVAALAWWPAATAAALAVETEATLSDARVEVVRIETRRGHATDLVTGFGSGLAPSIPTPRRTSDISSIHR